MKIIMAVACDAAIEYAGRLSILGSIDAIEARQSPIVKAQCSLAVQIQWQKDEEGPHTVKVHFMDQDGKAMLHDLETVTLVTAPAGRIFTTTTHVINLQQLKFTHEGAYLIAILVDNQHKAEIHIQVLKAALSSGRNTPCRKGAKGFGTTGLVQTLPLRGPLLNGWEILAALRWMKRN